MACTAGHIRQGTCGGIALGEMDKSPPPQTGREPSGALPDRP